jgi:ligand-binding sensor domain-containing protein/serine phosphatase RsbU (regulator of sigma subunit)
MKLNYKILIFLLSFFSGILSIYAQNIHVQSFSVGEGLSQSNVTCLLQDSRGFLWIGTQDGLNRYDGYEFTTFKHSATDTNSISNNTINSIIESDKGNIWIATNYGLDKYNPLTGQFTNYLHEDDQPSGLPQNQVFSVYQGSEGYIWIKTLYYLTRLDPETEEFRNYKHFNDYFNYYSRASNSLILEDDQGRIWVGTKDGLNLFDKELEIFKRYYNQPGDKSSLSSNQVQVVYQDNEGSLWIGTDDGLNKFDPETGTFDRYFVQRRIEDPVARNSINIIFEDKEGVLWVGTEGGIFQFNRQTGEFELSDNKTINEHRFATGAIRAIEQGRSKIIWVGTLQGLLKIKKNFKNFRLYRYDKAGNPLFDNNIIASVFKQDDNRIWVGTWNSGLYILNPNTLETEYYNESKPFIPDNNIHSFHLDSKERLWIGTQDGIAYYDFNAGRFNRVRTNKIDQVFSDNRVYDIEEDHEGNLWFGTRNGLHVLKSNNEIKSYYHASYNDQSISSNFVYDILIDSTGILWVGTNNGLNRFNKEEQTFTTFLREEITCNNCLINNEVLCLHEDSYNNIWIGTVGGLNKYNKAKKEFSSYTEEDGLPNNLIYSILEDDNGDFWISTNMGISRFDPIEEKFTNFGIYDGLQNYEFNHLASYKASDGELFFGGISGLNAFYPDSIRMSSYIPNIAITSLEIITNKGQKNYKLTGKDSIFIPYENNLVTIEFSALDLAEPEKNQYAYMLEGLENYWVHIGNRRFATFSNLPPGKYNFRVKGTNNDGVWNEKGTSLEIIVETPFWRNSLAYVLYGVMLILLIMLIIRWRTHRLRKANQQLKEKEIIAQQVAKQKEELSIKNKNITDSLIYAKRIQESLLPSDVTFKNMLHNSFILYKPKDIVSGDFYWVNEVEDKLFVAVVDCTGHGVPGAFMSIIGVELLHNITTEQHIVEADKILYDLNRGISLTLSKEGNEGRSIRDGMDVALCVIDKKNRQMEFAGAFRPLYLIRDNKINEIKGDRFSVGMLEDSMENPKINKKTIELKRDDVIYLFSDGYADQFGGPDSKKFKYRRFRHLLLTIHKLPMEQQKLYLDKSIEDWRGDQEQVDDILIVGFNPDV